MIEPNAAPQIHPSWFDWITVAAILIGPVLALFAQRALDWLRDKKNRRMRVYQTVMAHRQGWLHADSVHALNSIDTIFDRKRDKPIRDAWSAVIAQARIPRPEDNQQNEQRAWDQRLLDLRVDLYQLLGKAVGYNHSVDYIKNSIYTPQLYGDIETEQMLIRKGLASALSPSGLKVVLSEGQDNATRGAAT